MAADTLFFSLFFVSVILAISTFFFHNVRTKIWSNTNFVPGPPPLPLIGNIHQIPLKKSYLQFTKWADTYGSAYGLQLGPQRAIVLSTWSAIRDLLDQRGAIYSSRPTVPLVEYMGVRDLHVGFMAYDSRWRHARKTIAAFLTDDYQARMTGVRDAEMTQMVRDILHESGRFEQHVLRAFAGVLLAAVYGVRGKAEEVEAFYQTQDEFSRLLDPGALPPFDVLPFLKYVPDVVTPWRGWRRRADALKQSRIAVYAALFQGAQKRLREGRAGDSFVARIMEEKEKEGYSQREAEWLAGFCLEAGSDTTASSLFSFLLAMAAYPEAQRRAQEELDAAFGGERMPDGEGVESAELPFLRACFWETLRWRPPFPLAIPHATTKDDTYNGYTIPANTSVIMNLWAINHDAAEFSNPSFFDPTRFLVNPFGAMTTTSDNWRRPSYSFGAGRRVCAGRRMAEQSMVLAMAKLLWAFDIRPREGGVPLDLSIQTGLKDALLTAPKEGMVRFEARGRNEAVEKEWERADGFLRCFE